MASETLHVCPICQSRLTRQELVDNDKKCIVCDNPWTYDWKIL